MARVQSIQPGFIFIGLDEALAVFRWNWDGEFFLHALKINQALCQFFASVLGALGASIKTVRIHTRAHRAAYVKRFGGICQAALTQDALRWDAKTKVGMPTVGEHLGIFRVRLDVGFVCQAQVTAEAAAGEDHSHSVASRIDRMNSGDRVYLWGNRM